MFDIYLTLRQLLFDVKAKGGEKITEVNPKNVSVRAEEEEEDDDERKNAIESFLAKIKLSTDEMEKTSRE